MVESMVYPFRSDFRLTVLSSLMCLLDELTYPRLSYITSPAGVRVVSLRPVPKASDSLHGQTIDINQRVQTYLRNIHSLRELAPGNNPRVPDVSDHSAYICRPGLRLQVHTRELFAELDEIQGEDRACDSRVY
jgi:hypothetical protein